MFCPNCGTKNDDVAEKCSQCGFGLDQKRPNPKFKGTMILQAPAATAAAAAQAAAGAAPSGPTGAPPAGAAPSGSAVAPARSASLKGTMVGLAPPNIEELRRQLGETVRGGGPTPAASTSSIPPAGEASAPSAAEPLPTSKLKGTMIGVAPPSVADLKKATEAAAAGGAASTGPAAGSVAPSKLKGTMIGVAPPNVAELQKALAAQTASAAGAAQRAEGAAGSPPSSVNPLGGTMLGTSPFHSAAESPDAPTGDVPAAPGASAPSDAPEAPAPAIEGAAPGYGGAGYGGAPSFEPSARPAEQPAFLGSQISEPAFLPGVPAKNNGPLILLVALVVLVLVIGLALLV